MSRFHEPVLAAEVTDALAPAFEGGGTLVDATCGGGGHTIAFLSRTRPDQVVALDRDLDALAEAGARLSGAACPIVFVHADFADLRAVLDARGVALVRGIVADLGVSSHQLDTAERGFSFMHDGPLDMRLDRSSGPSAAELLEGLDEAALTRILRTYGEEPQAKRIARRILEARPQTTVELATLVREVVAARGWSARATHPATRTFQALRIAVNDEMGALRRFLSDAPECLEAGGRLAVITFHSLEDRPVKQSFQTLTHSPALPRGLPVVERDRPRPRFSVPEGYGKGVVPNAEEIARNPRSRSARLRVIERIAA